MFLDLSYLSSTFLSLLTCPHSFNCPLLMTVYKEGAEEDVCDTHSCFQNTLFFFFQKRTYWVFKKFTKNG